MERGVLDEDEVDLPLGGIAVVVEGRLGPVVPEGLQELVEDEGLVDPPVDEAPLEGGGGVDAEEMGGEPRVGDLLRLPREEDE